MHKIFNKSTQYICSLFLIVFLFLPASVYAQSNIKLTINYVEGLPLPDQYGYSVNVYFTALDSDRKSITNLSKDDLSLVEDSHQVEIDTITKSSELPIGLLLLIDTSGSMQGSPIQDARSAAANFVADLNQDDQVAVAEFNEQMAYISEFTNDHEQVSQKLNLINAENLASTCLYDTLYSAVQKSATLESGRRAITLLTDGQDYKSGSTCSIHTLDDVINLAADGNTQVPIYTIGLGDEINEKELKRLSEMTGGLYYYSPSSSDLQSIFSTLASQLSSQYIASYTSTSAPGSHVVVLEMKYANQTVQDSQGFLLPDFPTSITFINPLPGQDIDENAKLAVSVSGSGETIAKVSFFLGDSEIASDTTIPYEVSYSFNSNQKGTQTLTAIAYNSEGKQITSTSIIVNITKTSSNNSSTDDLNTTFEFDPLYVVVIVGTILVVIVSVILSKKKKKNEVFSDDFNVRSEKNAGDDRTLDLDLHEFQSHTKTENAVATLSILKSEDIGMIGQQLFVNKFPTTVGRSAKNDIVISKKDQAVSRNHITLDQSGQKIVLFETVSLGDDGKQKLPTYGTFINHKRVLSGEKITLNNGDEIQLGSKFICRFNNMQIQDPADEKTLDEFKLPDLDDRTREISREEFDSPDEKH